jgi:hypothetical protein
MARPFVSVESLRPSALTVAAAHPVHWGTVAGSAFVFLVMGALIPALAIQMIDVFLLTLAPRVPLIRRRLRARASRLARQRAAGRLRREEQVRWHDLEVLVARTGPIYGPSVELDQLLSTYLNVGLTLEHARGWSTAQGQRPSVPVSAASQKLATREGDFIDRSEAAIARLEEQLSTIATLIRCSCAEAISSRIEAASHLWAGEVEEAAQAVGDAIS